MDTSPDPVERDHAMEFTADIVVAYVSKHVVPAPQLPTLISYIHSALREIAAGTVLIDAPVSQEIKPAVPIRQSVSKDCIICLEDGLKFKSLKKHLKCSHSLTARQYKQRWNLPFDYPLVAPVSSSRRSERAKRTLLGHARAKSKS